MQQEVLRMITEANAAGATIFFSSHIMSEVESVAQRVGIIRSGRIIEVADPKTLGTRSLNRIRVRFQQDVNGAELAKLPGVSLLSSDNGDEVLLQVEGEADALIKALAKLPVRDLETQRPSLEEAFLTYYEEKGE
jgi:ABC-2 type transport system ATP-binding protein